MSVIMPRSWGAAKLFLMIVLAGLLTAGACPSTEQSLLDELKFALDRCSPVSDPESVATFCQTAVEKGEELVAEAPTDVNANLLLSNAYFGRAGLDFLDLLETTTNLIDTATDDFEEIRAALTGLTVDTTHLRDSVKVLSDLINDEGLSASENEDLFRQLGLMRALESFVRPVKLSVNTSNTFSEANLIVNIGGEEANTILSDFLNADNNLGDSGVDDEDILKPIRENYCRCSLQTPLGGSAGFNAVCLRDLMRCELNPDAADDTGDNGGVEQDYNSDGAINDVDCITLVTPSGLSSCAGRNTT